MQFLKPYFIQYRLKFIMAIVLMFIVAGATASYAYLVKEVLDKIFIEKNTQMLVVIPAMVVLIAFVKNTALFLQTRTMQVLMAKVTQNIQEALYKKYITSDISFFDSTPSGAMISRIFQTTSSISNGINTILVVLLREVVTVIALTVVLFIQNPVLTLFNLISIPLTVIPVTIIAKKMRKQIELGRVGMEGLVSCVDESLRLPKLVKSNDAENFEIQRVSTIFTKMLTVAKKVITLSTLLPSITETISIFGVAVVIWYGGCSVINGTLTTGEFFAFFTAMTIAYKPLKSISGLSLVVQGFVNSTQVIQTELEREITIKSTKNSIKLENVQGRIAFEGVSFKYNNQHEALTLNNVSFNVESGKVLAIVGPTGAGKSTIISLLERFYDPISGKITIDGIDISSVDLSSLRQNISLVSQDVQLFNDTIENNIKYTKVGATSAEVFHAARLANAEEFIEKMPDGYQTIVGQSGTKLSGGQKQRIAIARAILYNAPILLLDEATSALDSISEKLIQDALEKFMHNRTTIAIAHRLSTIINADKILVMQNGEIVESGTHSELIRSGGHYKKLYTTQFGEDIKGEYIK